jgi:predicted Zn-dependent peptidase
MIEAESDEEGLKLVFKLIYLLFMQTEPTEEALRSVLAAAPDAIGLRDKDPYRFFEDSLLDINTNGDRRLRPLACDDLAKVRLETVKEFFKRCFGNPSDFTLVVVGDVTVERVMDLAQRYLAAIEATQASFREGAPLSLTFPTETLHHYIQLPTEEEDITRVTYPLRLDMSQDRWTELDALTQIVETHLRNRLKEQVGSTCGVDVAYEFPLHPDPSVCWMSIEWRSEAKYTDRIAVLIDEDLETLIKEGVSEADCKGVQQVLHDNDLFWAQDNYFWLAMLSNYAKWHWSMEGLEQRKQAVDKIQCRQLADMLRSQLITKSHTSVTLRHGSATAPALPSGTRGGT